MPSFLSLAAALYGSVSAVNAASIPPLARDQMGVGNSSGNYANSEDWHRTKAVYFLSNNPDGASIIALDPINDGAPVITSTGGKGLAVQNTTSNTPMGPDSLTSQGAITVGGDYLFSVNPGSNTISMFKIDPQNPTKLELIGLPTDSAGEFPVSVTYSKKLRKVCALNGGARNNIACFDVDGEKGLTLDGPVRPLGLNVTTPPAAGSSTASQVSFKPDDSYLIATVKGAGSAPGSIWVWPVRQGCISEFGRETTIMNMPQPFGFAFDRYGSNFFISDPTYGGSVVTLEPDTLTIHEVRYTKSSQLKASCWAAYSETLDTFYAADAAVAQYGAYSPTSGALEGFVEFESALMGAFDTIISGATAWVITSSPNVVAIDLRSSKVLYNADLSGKVDDRKLWESVAIYPSAQSSW